MIAICRSNLGISIPPMQRYLGETDQTEYFPLKIGESYVVCALLFIVDRIDFLVQESGSSPSWVPSSLFDLVDPKVSAEWELCITPHHADYKSLFEAFKINCIMGYPLLVKDYQHYAGILERDPRELLRFMTICKPWILPE